MVPRLKRWTLFFLCFLLAGCWDMDLLRDARLVTLVGFDVTEEGKLETSVTIRETPSQEEGKMVNTFHSAVSHTPRQGRDFIDLGVSGHFRAYKNQAILFGEERAARDIYPLLDVFYRDPRNNISARMAVVEGKASDVLNLKAVDYVLVGEYINEVLDSMEGVSNVPIVNVQLVCPILLDPGEDFGLPMLRKKGKKVEVSGTALFHGHHMTGKLNVSESTMLLLLADELGPTARFTYKVDPGSGENPANFLTLNVKNEHFKREVMVEVGDEEEVDVHIVMKLRVSIEEYPRNELGDEQNIKRLNKQLAEGLEKEARDTLHKLQQARCDYLGIGRHLIAFHPEVWKKKKWSRDYPNVRFHPTVQVEMLDSGIIE